MIVLAATETVQAMVGAGLVHLMWDFLETMIGAGCAYFLISAIWRGMVAHVKLGTARAIGAILGGVGIAIIVAHIGGIFQRGNSEVDQMPGGVGHSNVIHYGL